jgi:hypothetical protein
MHAARILLLKMPRRRYVLSKRSMAGKKWPPGFGISRTDGHDRNDDARSMPAQEVFTVTQFADSATLQQNRCTM